MIHPRGTLANISGGTATGVLVWFLGASAMYAYASGLAMALLGAWFWARLQSMDPSVQRMLAEGRIDEFRTAPHPSGLSQEAYQRVERVVHEVMGRATRFDFDVGPDEVDLWIYPEWKLEVHEGPYWWHEASKQLHIVLHRLRGVTFDYKQPQGREAGYRLRGIDPWQPPGETQYTLGMPPHRGHVEDIVRKHLGEGPSWDVVRRPSGIYDLKIYHGQGIRWVGDKTRLREFDAQTYVPLMKDLGGTRWTRGVYDARSTEPKVMHIIEHIRI